MSFNSCWKIKRLTTKNYNNLQIYMDLFPIIQSKLYKGMAQSQWIIKSIPNTRVNKNQKIF